MTEPWLDLEETFCNNLENSNLPFISPNIKDNKCFKAITSAPLLTAWWEFLKIKSLHSTRVIAHRSETIRQNKTMLNFTQWNNHGIKFFFKYKQKSKIFRISNALFWGCAAELGDGGSWTQANRYLCLNVD